MQPPKNPPHLRRAGRNGAGQVNNKVDNEKKLRSQILRKMEAQGWVKNAISPVPPSWSSENMRDWSHVTSSFIDSAFRVVEINLDSMSVKGKLPSGLNNSLPYLARLILNDNSLTGPLPSLAGLFNLQLVDLSYNNFTSLPPGCFHGLESLDSLRLDNNNNLAPWTLFSADVTDSSLLTSLSLPATNLMGSLPDTFASFTSL
ncbi:hypothetical protein PIB30_025758 [Stylosanthes scabra]|uniref:Uncharacterized protein n=1 Tax=Stylosanthes scabra TaxID=79078 RepID=A0ABU6RAI7_9FABA|nr:hypothetical protein [Stylosanthes scabra]